MIRMVRKFFYTQWLQIHLELDRCHLENVNICDIDSSVSFVCFICDSVYALYTCKQQTKVVQYLVKGECVGVCTRVYRCIGA